ncbi:MAG: hypothetical protein ACI80S_002106, partial [Pseudohongiellaceae bacterium]
GELNFTLVFKFKAVLPAADDATALIMSNLKLISTLMPWRYQRPIFSIEAQGSIGSSAAPFCKSSIEIPSGERTKAI